MMTRPRPAASAVLLQGVLARAVQGVGCGMKGKLHCNGVTLAHVPEDIEKRVGELVVAAALQREHVGYEDLEHRAAAHLYQRRESERLWVCAVW